MADNDMMLAAYGISECGCYECVDKVISARPWPENLYYPFIVCATCGNKRCPQAQSHDLTCTGSNDAGQPGAVRYPKVELPDGRMTEAEIKAWLDEADANETKEAVTDELS